MVAYAWWPSDNEAGVASLRALSDTGIPVIQTNQLPFSRVGELRGRLRGAVNDKLNGEVAANLLIEARDHMVASGKELHGAGGHAIVIGFVAGYQARYRPFRGPPSRSWPAPASPVLGEVDVGFGAGRGGTRGTKQLIAAHRNTGIDLVYAHNSALAEGVIQALEEEGYHPGDDVMVVGGTCHGNLDHLLDGSEFATGLQAARLEGVFSINTLHEYLTNGSLELFNNFIPQPAGA